MIRSAIRRLSSSSSGGGGGNISNKPRFKIDFAKECEEKFIRTASGSGGQKVNKSAHGVQLTHLETGVQVKVMDSRSLEINRHLARKRVSEQVEWRKFGMDSRKGREILRLKRNNSRQRKRALEKYHPNDVDIDDGDDIDDGNGKLLGKLDPKILFHLHDNDDKR